MAVLENRNVIMKIGDKEYNFRYTIRAVIQLEQRLDKKSVLNTLAEPPMSFNDTFEFFHHGLIGGGNKISVDEAEELMMQYFEEKNLGELQAEMLEALMKSGVIGKIEKNS